MIKHHVKEEEKRAEGLFAQAREAGLDIDDLGDRMAAEKAKLMTDLRPADLPIPPTPTFTGTTLATH
jgi:hypothetical protein